jgi:hypothetical protein
MRSPVSVSTEIRASSAMASIFFLSSQRLSCLKTAWSRGEVEPAAFDLDAQRHVEPAAVVLLDVHQPFGGHQHPVAEVGRAVDAPAGLAQGRRGEGEEVGPVGFALEAVHAVGRGPEGRSRPA